MKIFIVCVVALIVVVIYFDQGDNAQSVQNRMGALFFLCLNNGFSGVNSVSLIFPMERPVFLREVNNNMYGVGAYFWAKVITEFPMTILCPLI